MVGSRSLEGDQPHVLTDRRSGGDRPGGGVPEALADATAADRQGEKQRCSQPRQPDDGRVTPADTRPGAGDTTARTGDTWIDCHAGNPEVLAASAAVQGE